MTDASTNLHKLSTTLPQKECCIVAELFWKSRTSVANWCSYRCSSRPPCSTIWGPARVNIVTEPSHLFHSLFYHTTATSPPKLTRENSLQFRFFSPFVILSITQGKWYGRKDEKVWVQMKRNHIFWNESTVTLWGHMELIHWWPYSIIIWPIISLWSMSYSPPWVGVHH